MELCDFNPNDIRIEDTVENSNITFTQLQVKEALNRIYMERDVHINGNPHNTNIGYTMCRYINWIDEVNVIIIIIIEGLSLLRDGMCIETVIQITPA